ncbi:MAG TPA: nucleotidyltransferase family protein [Candidatus Paceibacterota bacterium]
MVSAKEIGKKIEPILKSAGASRAAIFGSYARGEQNAESDVDILIEPPNGMSLMDLAHLQILLQEVTGTKVDIVTYNSLHHLIRPYVMKDAIEIF